MQAAGSAISCELLSREDGTGRGSRILRLRSGEVDLDIEVDRGFDLGHAAVRGLPVSWKSPMAPVAPALAAVDAADGWGPLRSFNGGLLLTCGLDHVLGPAEESTDRFNYPGPARERLPLHGRLSTLPASLTGHGLDQGGDEAVIYATGEVRQARLFGENLLLRRRVELPVSSTVIRLEDEVRNDGYTAVPNLMLYHFNFGAPLKSPGTRVTGNFKPDVARTQTTVPGEWTDCGPVDAARAERAWQHRATGSICEAGLLNPDIGDGRALGAVIRFNPDRLPHLLQWEASQPGHYVTGLEPGNVSLAGRKQALSTGTAPMLEPGESCHYRLEIELIHSVDRLNTIRKVPE